MTRSSARRHNRHARLIATSIPKARLVRSYDKEGAFVAHGAQRFTESLVNPEISDEVNWPLCAELLNQRARRAA